MWRIAHRSWKTNPGNFSAKAEPDRIFEETNNNSPTDEGKLKRIHELQGELLMILYSEL